MKQFSFSNNALLVHNMKDRIVQFPPLENGGEEVSGAKKRKPLKTTKLQVCRPSSPSVANSMSIFWKIYFSIFPVDLTTNMRHCFKFLRHSSMSIEIDLMRQNTQSLFENSLGSTTAIL